VDIVSISEYFRQASEVVLLRRLAVVAIYAVLAKVFGLLSDRVLRRLAARTKFDFDDILVDFLHTPIYWTIFLLGVLHAMVLPPLPVPWQFVLPATIKSLLLLVWTVGLIRFLNLLAERNLAATFTRGKVGKDMFLLIKNIVRVVVAVTGLLWLLSIWQVDLTPLFASAGIAGIAVALAAKDTLANFFGGISLFMDNTFKVGDFIILDTGERGEVVEIGIRSTRVNTRDDVLITIPNSILANAKIINESAPVPRFRIRVPVGIAYGSDLGKVEEVLLAVTRANPSIAADPEPRVRLRAFADSSVNYELLCWVDDPSLKGREIHNLLKAIYQAFAEHAIVIPFPQRDVHLVEQSREENQA